jgi:hypothetical protein
MRTMKKTTLWLRALCGALASWAAAAPLSAQDRPLLTESARVAPAGTLTVETGLDVLRAEPNFLTGGERDVWAGPLLRFTYAPADAAEFELEWVARVGQRDDPAFGSSSDFGDVSLRAKLRLAPERGSRPALAARFAVTLPQTSFGDGLGPNTLRFTAQLLLTRAFGRATLSANAGLAIHDEPLRAHEQRDFLAYGLALGRRVGARAEFVGEVAGLLGDGLPGADARSEARLGLRLGGEALRGDVAVRRGLAEADGTWGLTLGLTRRLRAR